MEKKGYRENLEQLSVMFPDRLTITPQEAARILGCNIKTIYTSMARVRNPLPAVRLTPKKILIPISELANWLV